MKKPRKIIRRLVLSEVSAVDRPCQEGALATITKAEPATPVTTINVSKLAQEAKRMTPEGKAELAALAAKLNNKEETNSMSKSTNQLIEDRMNKTSETYLQAFEWVAKNDPRFSEAYDKEYVESQERARLMNRVTY